MNEEIILNVETNSPYVIGAVAYVEQLENGAKITIVDKNGTTTATVYDGNDGKSISSITLNDDYTLTILYTDGDTTTTSSIRGATGASGVYYGEEEPIDPAINVWVDPADGDGSVLKIRDEDDQWAPIESIVGEPAGFGTVTATVDANHGTPAVTVTTSGDDTAKNFAFAFSNLQPAPYDDSELQADFAVLQGQFDTAVAAVTTDTEVTDIRVGADGITDTTAGASVRRQFTDLKSDLGNVYYVQLGNNLLNPSTYTTGYLESNGTVDTTSTSYKTSDYIELEPDEDYTFTGYLSDGRQSTSRKLVALYDANKAFIANSHQNVNNVSALSFNSNNAKYARVCLSADKGFVKKGATAPTTFEAYSESYVSKLDYADDSIPTNAVKNVASTEAVNLYTGQNEFFGVFMSNGLVDYGTTSYKITAPIKVKAGYSYLIQPRLRMLAMYSDETISEDTFISWDSSEKTTPYNFVPQYDGYLRICYNVNYPLTAINSSFDGTIEKKNEEGIGLSNTQLRQVGGNSNILYGKKWVVCGDSFTNDGGTGSVIQEGKYAGASYTYPWLIGNRNSMDIVKFFEGGRTLAFPAIPETFTNALTCPTADWYYQNIPLDADYITIYLGINDEHHATGGGDGEDPTGYIPLGAIDDSTTDSYYGAWNVVLSWLIENRPNAHIGIIVTNGIENNDNYRLAQIAIANKYGIPYIDMNGDSRTTAMIRTSNPNIPSSIKQILKEKWSADYPSNQHPNDDAQEFESTFIENFLRSI